MKSLTQFLEAHNFIIKGHTKKQGEGIIDFPILKTIEAYREYEFIKYKKIDLGRGPFYIYNDKYGGRKHIASKGDIESRIGWNYDDFEDFSEKDIIADFKTVKDAVIYMLKENNIDDGEIAMLERDEMGFDESVEWLEDHDGTDNYLDTPEFVYKVLTGEWKDKNCIFDSYDMLNIMVEDLGYEIKNLPKK